MSAALGTSPTRARHAALAPIRVGISGLFLEYPHSGTGRYARRVIEQLAQAPDLESLVITNQSASTHPDLRLTGGALCQEATSASPLRPRLVTAPQCPIRLGKYAQKLYWEQVGLRVACWRLGVNVLYSPHFSLPLFPSCPSVLSIHDLIPLTDPDYAASAAVKAYFRLVCAAARQATAVVTLSAFSKGEIERLLGLDPARISVVPPGAEPAFQPLPDPLALSRARDRLTLPPAYLLYVGGRDRRKNIGILLEALALLRREDSASAMSLPPLVVAAARVGSDAPTQFPDWRAQAARLGLGAAVHFVDRIAEEDLPAVYRGATALCFPSRAEGFGLTPLEAMACGTPVVCSNATSLPEAVGEAGILLSPDDTAGWAQAMLRVVREGGLRDRLRALGLARARQFRWESTGQQVHGIIVAAARTTT